MTLNATGMAMTSSKICTGVIGRRGARSLGATFLSHQDRRMRWPHSVHLGLVRWLTCPHSLHLRNRCDPQLLHSAASCGLTWSHLAQVNWRWRSPPGALSFVLCAVSDMG